MRNYLILFLLIFLIQQIKCDLRTLKYCCNLGTNYAKAGSKCNSFQTPIVGVEREDEKSCLHSIEVCCKNQNQESQCDLGIRDAKNGINCGGIDSEDGFRKDCCDACELGISAGGVCDDLLALGPPYNKAFTTCCQDAAKTTSTTKTTTTTRTLTGITSSSSPTERTRPDDSGNEPPLENVCDIGDVCAQICIPTEKSYKCACNKGFTLMADGISCKPDKNNNNNNNNNNNKPGRLGDRCSVPNPCDHICTDTGVAIKCSCREGYELAADKRTCKDIDECALNLHDCDANEVCTNDEGVYYCDDPNFAEGNDDDFDSKCPPGYKFNGENSVCDDIDECEFDIICPRPKVCKNTVGSFICEGDDRPQCPPGFYFKASIDSCADIDECLSGENHCNRESQVCLNTKGNYTCIDKVSKKTCPPGFKRNILTQICEDINECEENDELCNPNEICVNEQGGHTCVPKADSSASASSSSSSSSASPTVSDNLNKKASTFPTTTTRATSTAVSSTTISTTTSTTTKAPPPAEPQFRPVTCPQGYRYDAKTVSCSDINECQEDPHTCDDNQNCYNIPGSYICNCKTGFSKDHQTGGCADINECQIGAHDCTVAQRCDNTIGSYICARITGCGTGYTFNYANGLCEDDDECALGTHTCRSLGANYKCRNTLGSYRCDPIIRSNLKPQSNIPTSYKPVVLRYPIPPALPLPSPPPPPPTTTYFLNNNINNNATPLSLFPLFTTPTYSILSGTNKKCLPGYRMNANGNCEDIDECERNPCGKGKKCLNFNGHYECLSTTICKIGYEPDESGEGCIDINECSRGIHRCNPTQICKNGQGYYTCECPSGHHLNRITNNCEDINECKYYKVCSINAECINTVGSYKCRCKEGFREHGNICDDIDECKEMDKLCQHKCVNVWGSYRCACDPGFILNSDNRTCTDVDECERFKDQKLCIGTCQNIPGSYACTCPNGYRLGSDKRTCKDIDECEHNICRNPDDVCLNTRGGYKCNTIKCPQNYIRDPEHRSRCKRPQNLCDPRDVECILKPEQYSYHYITLVSNLPIQDQIQFFVMNGPLWASIRAKFSMKIVNVYCPHGIKCCDESYFKTTTWQNTLQLYLVKPIQGPQEIELKIEMVLYENNIRSRTAVSHIFIVVSEYPF